MPRSFTPILASQRRAAELLDMKPAEFRMLVTEGHLPKPKRIGELERWDVEELRQIGGGTAARGVEGVRW